MKKKQVVASLLVAVSVLGTSPLAALAEEGKVTSPVDVVVPSPSDNEKVPVPTEKEEKPKDDKTQTGEVTPETPVNPTIPDKSGENLSLIHIFVVTLQVDKKEETYRVQKLEHGISKKYAAELK